MQDVVELNLPRLQKASALQHGQQSRIFVASLLVCVAGSALLASWLPLQVSIVTVFLFAGPHNWFELRYFLQRLPVRFGRSRNFFILAFAGIGLLTAAYISLPFIFSSSSEQRWLAILATWNTLMLIWVATLVWLRGRQKRRNWSLVFPIVLAISAGNWLAPQIFSLTIVYIHPLVALWFLDRHLARTKPAWLKTYRRSLALIPLALTVMIWRLSQTASLPDDNGLFWRITQHSGAELLPYFSSHMLVTVHLFLEMLHYGIWLLALPLIGSIATAGDSRRVWQVASIPVARHPRGFPRLIAGLLVLGVAVVVMLWIGFSIDYSTTRDIYFTVAMAHVLAEAPFLLKMI